jgi:hypothetical protein
MPAAARSRCNHALGVAGFDVSDLGPTAVIYLLLSELGFLHRLASLRA